MNVSSRFAKATLAGAISIAASCAYALPVDVSYSVTGSSGDWLLDFTVANNFASGADDQTIFLFALQLQPGAFADTPADFTPISGPFDFAPSDGGPLASYDFGWMDLGLLGGGPPHLTPTISESGFVIHSDGVDAPDSISWALASVALAGDGSVTTFQGVSVAPAVPEPSTYALMFLGLAALGLYRRVKAKE
jgi:hypothetical protein